MRPTTEMQESFSETRYLPFLLMSRSLLQSSPWDFHLRKKTYFFRGLLNLPGYTSNHTARIFWIVCLSFCGNSRAVSSLMCAGAFKICSQIFSWKITVCRSAAGAEITVYRSQAM